jgi:hypothetical protein
MICDRHTRAGNTHSVPAIPACIADDAVHQAGVQVEQKCLIEVAIASMQFVNQPYKSAVVISGLQLLDERSIRQRPIGEHHRFRISHGHGAAFDCIGVIGHQDGKTVEQRGVLEKASRREATGLGSGDQFVEGVGVERSTADELDERSIDIRQRRLSGRRTAFQPVVQAHQRHAQMIRERLLAHLGRRKDLLELADVLHVENIISQISLYKEIFSY